MSKPLTEFEVMSCENGFLLMEGTYRNNSPMAMKRWVAKSNVELGKLVEQLTAPEQPAPEAEE